MMRYLHKHRHHPTTWWDWGQPRKSQSWQPVSRLRIELATSRIQRTNQYTYGSWLIDILLRVKDLGRRSGISVGRNAGRMFRDQYMTSVVFNCFHLFKESSGN